MGAISQLPWQHEAAALGDALSIRSASTVPTETFDSSHLMDDLLLNGFP